MNCGLQCPAWIFAPNLKSDSPLWCLSHSVKACALPVSTFRQCSPTLEVSGRRSCCLSVPSTKDKASWLDGFEGLKTQRLPHVKRGWPGLRIEDPGQPLKAIVCHSYAALSLGPHCCSSRRGAGGGGL